MKQNDPPQFDDLRKIIHLHIDGLLALIEQRENGSGPHTPLLIVGDSPQSKVEAVSPAAHALGLNPGMARHQVLKRHPHVQCIKPDYEKYQRVGHQVNALFREYTEWIETISPAESYLDITYNKLDIPFGRRTAQLIRSDLWHQFGYKARIGIAPNKMLAKIASTLGENDEIREILRDEFDEVLCDKPISLLPYIGPTTKEKLARAHIETIGQLAQIDQVALRELCGRQSALLGRLARGHDDHPVCLTAKAITRQMLFPAPLYALDEIRDALRPLVDDLTGQLRRRNLRCRQLTLHIRPALGEVFTTTSQLSHFSDQASTLLSAIRMLIAESSLYSGGIRCIDVEFSGFTDRDIEQLDLFPPMPPATTKKEAGRTGLLD